MQPKSVEKRMRGNHYWGVFHLDRALPSPSPTANLVGIWKGNGQKFKPLPCQRFSISPPFCLLILFQNIFVKYET